MAELMPPEVSPARPLTDLSAKPTLSVTYANVQRDLIGLLHHLLNASRKGQSRGPVILATAAMWGLLIWISYEDQGRGFFDLGDVFLGTLRYPIAAMVCLFSGLLLVPMMAEIYLRLATRKISPMVSWPRTVQVSAAGVDVQNELFDGHSPWKGIEVVEESPDLILLFLSKRSRATTAYIIPKSAFASPAEATRFVTLAKECKELAQPADSPAQVVVAEAVETGNPYQSPRS